MKPWQIERLIHASEMAVIGDRDKLKKAFTPEALKPGQDYALLVVKVDK